MKKVNWSMLAVETALCTLLVALIVRLFQQLKELDAINPNLMGIIDDIPDGN